MDERLRQAIADVGEDRWSAFAVDDQARLVWVSAELKGFLGEATDEGLGVGKNLLTAFVEMPAWHGSLTPESGIELFRDMYRYLTALLADRPDAAMPDLPADFKDLIDDLPRGPGDAPVMVTGCIQYIAPGSVAYPVEYVSPVLRDETGALIGAI